MSAAPLTEIAAEAVRLAVAQGANDAECTLAEGEEFVVNVRMGEVERLKEAGSKAAGLRVLVGQHTGSSYTSDLTPEGIRHMVSSALEVARITSDDPHAGLPESGDLGSIGDHLQLYCDDVATLDAAEKIRRAKEAEAAALGADPRIANSEGAAFDTYTGMRVFANSRGFLGSYRTSMCSLSAVPVAKEGDSMERDYWYSVSRSCAGLEDPAAIGRKAAERAVRRLGARKVPTQKVPVVFEPRVARTLLDHIFEGVSGDSVYRKASFLAGRLGEKVAADNVTVIDDGTIPGLFGTSPFDDEGAPSRRTVVIERGVLKSYLLNTYTGRKLGLKTTGNASRGITGNAGVGHGNFFFEKGTAPPEEILRSIRSGFYVTELIGFGVNIVNGDYSRGAAGLWIENGELAYPVSEVTIAGNLKDMFLGIGQIASDLEFRGSSASPTVLIDEMTVGGQ